MLSTKGFCPSRFVCVNVCERLTFYMQVCELSMKYFRHESM